MAMIRVDDYQYPGGWADIGQSSERARWCCEQLEANHILFFPGIPFGFNQNDIDILLKHKDAKSKTRKNITYNSHNAVLRGVDEPNAAAEMKTAMKHYAEGAQSFLKQVLTPYSASWTLFDASYRPEQEEGRDIETLKRNDLLHTDAFKDQPTHGDRILRCFSNINPAEPRVWISTDPFPTLAEKYGKAAGLDSIAATPPVKLGMLQKLRAKKGANRSNYDAFMLAFHDFLKLNEDYQGNYPKQRFEFPPNCTWMCFTDAVPHAVLSGQFALEQTLIVALKSLVTPEKSPLRVLEKLAGVPMTA